MLKVFSVSRGGYYTWLKRLPSKRQEETLKVETAVKAAHDRTRGTYGPERLQTELAKVDDIEIGKDRLKYSRRKLGITCKQVKKFKATTNSKHKFPVADNLLEQNFSVTRPGEVWVADITYIPTDEGWLYLAGIKDLFNGEIVGYAMHERMTRGLCGKALFNAVKSKRPPKDLIHHSDRGSQYCSHDYQRLLKQFGMQPSMSRKGNYCDNAPMERYFGALKNELIHHRRFRTRQEATQEIREYIEVFYNRQRRQKRLGYISPAEYEREYYR